MPIKKVLIYPDPILLAKSDPVEDVHSDEVKKICQDLTDTFIYFDEEVSPSVGLAAPQIGYNKRILMVDIPKEHYDGQGTDGRLILINPEIKVVGEECFTWDEACLSVPEESGPVTRDKHIVVNYLDVNGNPQQLDFNGSASGVIQHEADHLDGILWVHYQGKLKQKLVTKRMAKLRKVLDPDDGPYGV